MTPRYNAPPDLTNIFDQTVPGHYETDEYVFFWSGPFSNWHPAKFILPWNGFGRNMNCSEQAMMFIKAEFFNDTESSNKILQEKDPSIQKALGRVVKGYDEAKWVEVRESYSDYFLLRKFAQNENLMNILLDTGNKIIVEASPYDKVWGIAMGVDKYPDILDPKKWKGQNLLGESLMRVRERLRSSEELFSLLFESELIIAIRDEIDKQMIKRILEVAKPNE